MPSTSSDTPNDELPALTNEGDLLYTAWTIIANAHGGDWDSASPEWKQAAERWRDRFHAYLEQEEVLDA